MRYVELIRLDVQAFDEENDPVLQFLLEVGYINEDEFEEIQKVGFWSWTWAKMSGNKSETSEITLTAPAMPPRREMTCAPGDVTSKMEWDKERTIKQLSKAEAMIGIWEPDATVLLAF